MMCGGAVDHARRMDRRRTLLSRHRTVYLRLMTKTLLKVAGLVALAFWALPLALGYVLPVLWRVNLALR
jgi:hypothetical protein